MKQISLISWNAVLMFFLDLKYPLEIILVGLSILLTLLLCVKTYFDIRKHFDHKKWTK